MMEQTTNDNTNHIDPYDAFESWCRANGYADVMDSLIEETDTERLYEAVAKYGAEEEA